MLNRRGLLALALAPFALVDSVYAQAYPSKPVMIVAPWPGGGTADVVARVIGERLQSALGQPIVIDNRPGAAGSIGTTFVARAPADGYTLLSASQSHTANPSLYSNLPWDPVKSFVPIIMVGVIPNVIVVPSSSPHRTLAEFVAYVKTQPPGQLNYGSAGVGTSIHLTGEMLKQAAGISLTHIPFRSDADSYSAIRSGDVAMAPLGLAFAKQLIDSGELRALAVTTPKRSRLLPNVPTAAEAGFPQFDVRPWYAILAPAGTPEPVVAKLNTAFTAAIKSPEIQTKLMGMGLELDPGTPEDLAKFIQADSSRWARTIKQAGIKLD